MANNENLKITLNSYIRQLRLSKWYSLNYLEYVSKVTATYIHRIEKWIRKIPSLTVLEKLAIALDIKTIELTKLLKNTK